MTQHNRDRDQGRRAPHHSFSAATVTEERVNSPAGSSCFARGLRAEAFSPERVRAALTGGGVTSNHTSRTSVSEHSFVKRA